MAIVDCELQTGKVTDCSGAPGNGSVAKGIGPLVPLNQAPPATATIWFTTGGVTSTNVMAEAGGRSPKPSQN